MSIKLPKVPAFGRNAKIWGWTQTVALTDKMHVAYAFLNNEGYSSKHYHKNLWNRFVVIEGSLKIEIFRNDRQEVVNLKDNDIFDAEPMLPHRMVALSDVKLIEIYWPQEGVLDPEDIVREDVGGINIPPFTLKLTFPPDEQWVPSPLPVMGDGIIFTAPVQPYQPHYNDSTGEQLK